MKEKILYILIALIVFNFTYYVTSAFVKQESPKTNTAQKLSEEDLLETIKLNLDSRNHHYYDWENRKYNGIEILCQSPAKILYNIDLEEIGKRPTENQNLFYDYQKIYLGLEKTNNYYFEKYFAGEDLLEEFPLDKENYCE